MPGIILTSRIAPERVETAAQQLKFTPSYSHETHISEDELTLISNRYDNYPIRQFKVDELHFYFEGYIYNRSDEDVINEVKSALLDSKYDVLANKISSYDGEFFMIVVNKQKQIVHLFNDSWGRLPVYIYENEQEKIVSREIKFITSIVDQLNYDPISVANNLMFGYSLGHKTIWQGVRKMAPHSIITIDLNSNKLGDRNFFDLKFNNENNSKDELAEEILQKIETSLDHRIQKLPQPSLSLSGGLDSRLIAACLKKINRSIPLTTYSSYDQSTNPDIKSGSQIVKQLGFENLHELIPLRNTEIKDLFLLADIKQGLNFLGMSFIIPYYQYLSDKNYSTITGDGGDKFLVDLTPPKKIKSEQQLINCILKYNSTCSIEEAAQLANVTPKEIIDHLKTHLNNYPVEDYNLKYAHFIVKERGINWLFEGEDRNRYFSWSTSPFYNPELIQLCLKYPMNAKRYGQLFLKLFNKLPGNLASILNPNWMLPLNDQKGIKRLHFKQNLKMYIPNILLSSLAKTNLDTFVYRDLLKEQLVKKSDTEIINQTVVENITCSSTLYWRMLTLLIQNRAN
ncbi:MAG: hypothetical protein JKY09_05250 [Crocinitomicaceae bacterium]|nr:hypothetical protein [Crocinitomicaceae bacterium]